MNPKISILIPSIRPHLLEGVYNSITKSFSQEWELVLASPYPLPSSLKEKTNVVYINDAGTPIRGRQMALLEANGDYICYSADDCTFYPNSLDISYNTIKDKDYKTIVLGKYLEGSEDNPFMLTDSYYHLITHDFLKPIMQNFPKTYKLLNTGLFSRKLLLEIGGFECRFEACAMSCCDLSIRVQNYECPIIIQNEPFFHATHLPMRLGDHASIHEAQTIHDQPLFLHMYMDERSKYRTIIDIDNWKNSPSWWVRRFGKQEEECLHSIENRVVVAGRSTCSKCGALEP